MKGLPLLQSIVSILLVLVVGAVGAYAVIMSMETVRSKITFDLVDSSNINLEITANAEWVEPSDENFQFTAETKTDGLTSSSWTMPNINFSTTEPVLETAVLSLTVVNRNEQGGNRVKITLSNIAYDMEKDNPANYRFRSKISTSQDSFFSKTEIMVNAVSKEYTLEANSTIVIKIEYILEISNSIFSINQNIHVAFDSDIN